MRKEALLILKRRVSLNAFLSAVLYDICGFYLKPDVLGGLIECSLPVLFLPLEENIVLFIPVSAELAHVLRALSLWHLSVIS